MAKMDESLNMMAELKKTTNGYCYVKLFVQPNYCFYLGLYDDEGELPEQIAETIIKRINGGNNGK